jgi:hypothetical protein
MYEGSQQQNATIPNSKPKTEPPPGICLGSWFSDCRESFLIAAQAASTWKKTVSPIFFPHEAASRQYENPMLIHGGFPKTSVFGKASLFRG